MELHGFLQIFFGGVVGALVIEVYRIWWRLKHARPLKKLLLYIVAILSNLLLGGLVAIIQGMPEVTLRVAAHLGMTAPALVSILATRANRRRQESSLRIAPEPVKTLPAILEALSW